ncbi:hemerythrin domain-containing protein [Streptomyces yaanensis]|uniref:Hemerythrin domain-containing protein n=1 Tax=Streptomyces yaanensis TaxID=1142239 RepID=A0ABV7S6L3_9ACTN|nr:hemerythrin domain-containing protein [Streptomyces sp. CGMCC 4.7035]WNB99987.1 hemerythrin domain-containing protein [Streptomyces sp. CGMCC 4.7035]
MCEYCGCQALESIDQLTMEHEAVVNLIGQVRGAHRDGKIAYMAEPAREIAAVLGPHTQVEEHGLFPAMAADFPEKIRRPVLPLASCVSRSPSPAAESWPVRCVTALP